MGQAGPQPSTHTQARRAGEWVRQALNHLHTHTHTHTHTGKEGQGVGQAGPQASTHTHTYTHTHTSKGMRGQVTGGQEAGLGLKAGKCDSESEPDHSSLHRKKKHKRFEAIKPSLENPKEPGSLQSMGSPRVAYD